MTDIALTSAFWIAAFALFLHFRKPGAITAGLPLSIVTELSALGLVVTHDGQAAIKRFEEFEASFRPEAFIQRIIDAMTQAFQDALAQLHVAHEADKAKAVADAVAAANAAHAATAAADLAAAHDAGAAEASDANTAAVLAAAAALNPPPLEPPVGG
jgi:hypothetical protein